MSILSNDQKIDLHNMIKANDTEDFTEDIRKKKQSKLIHDDIKHMVYLKKNYQRLSKSNPNEFDNICIKQCNFLFNNYTDIYNKVKNDTLNLTIMEKFLSVLKKIEDGNIDQHEGSYLVGQYLKQLYIDSAIKNQEKINNQSNKKKVMKKPIVNEKKISYKEFKQMNT